MKKIAALLAVMFMLTAWSIPEAHEEANRTLVQVGEWCSGTVINKEQGLVLTAYHCLGPVTHRVSVKNWDERKFKYENFEVYTPFTVTQRKIDMYGKELGAVKYDVVVMIGGVDTEEDIAILKNVSDVPFDYQATLSKKLPAFGDKVYTSGNPLGMLGVITEGKVAQPNIKLPGLDNRVILHTASVDHGNSGGPLFNDDGCVIGINNWKNPNGYENFSVRMEVIAALLDRLKITGVDFH